MVLIADLLVALAGLESARSARQTITVTISAVLAATFLICGAAYTASEERLSYADLPDEPAVRSTLPELARMATPGPYLPEFDELARFASAHIPQQDGLILLRRRPLLLCHRPYAPVPGSPLRSGNRPLLARRSARSGARPQHPLAHRQEPSPDQTGPHAQRDATVQLLLGEFNLDTRLKGYDVYRRR